MKSETLFKGALGLAALLLGVTLVIGFTSGLSGAGPYLIGFFFLFAIGSRGYQNLKGYSYPLMIFGAVTTAMYYPQYFVEYDGFKFSALIIPLIQIIMFGMGTSMSVQDFVAVAKTPRAVLIGVGAQFIIMPGLGFLLARASGLEPEIAAGIVLIGCSPSGLASNVMNYIAKANLALSITITSVTTLIAPFVTPVLMKLLAGALVEISILNMMWDISKMIILPIAAGLLFNKFLRGKAKWLDDAMPLVSMAGIGLILVVIVAAGREALLGIGALLILLVGVHNLTGYCLGYWAGRAFRMDERDCRTIAIEVGMQNGGLATGIAKGMGKLATMGLAPAVFGSLMNVTGSLLASYWHRRPPEEKDKPLEVTAKSPI
jgi:BASS family bile acid:Na+ symporter